MLFFSQEHCINYKIKNISTGSHILIIHSALIIYIVANDNTLLLCSTYSVGQCNSRLDSCWCFCIVIAHNHRLNANPKKAKTVGCVSLVLLGHEISLLFPKE